jgi:hypothetical protein
LTENPNEGIVICNASNVLMKLVILLRTPHNVSHKGNANTNQISSIKSTTSASTSHIMRMQQTVGNQAVIRSLGGARAIQLMKETTSKGTTKDAENRKRVDVPFGFGMSGPMDQYNFYSSNFNSCNAVSMFNQKTKIGGLFHLLGGGVKVATSALTTMFKDIMPTQINLYNGASTEGDDFSLKNSTNIYEKGWKRDHDELKQLFIELKSDLKYDEKQMTLKINIDEENQTPSLSAVINDKGDYQSEKYAMGKDFVKNGMDFKMEKAMKLKAEENGISVYNPDMENNVISSESEKSVMEKYEDERRIQFLLKAQKKFVEAKKKNDFDELYDILFSLESSGMVDPKDLHMNSTDFFILDSTEKVTSLEKSFDTLLNK